MDFFEHQDRARRNTTRLIILFTLAVVATVIAVYLAVVVIWHFFLMSDYAPTAERGPAATGQFDLFPHPMLFPAVAGGTVLIIGLGSLYKIIALRGGGSAVAEALGGRRVSSGTRDPHERKLLNIVEEMALASGTPVPPAYVMSEEHGINAFAAGYSPADAVVGVTRGCIEQLSRDELQGVIAHEFSHILNGDMRLNIRLIGVLNGILIIGLIGWTMLRMTMRPRYGYGYSRRRSGRNEGGAIIAMLALGVALMVIGYIGTFFGSLIKAAMSRQREFLADASAVQFTRNPGGIAGALKKIGGFSMGSRIEHPQGEEISHMFFGEGYRSMLGSLLSTHPPLAERIRRVDPQFDGTFVKPERPRRGPAPGHPAAAAGVSAMADASPQDRPPPVARPAVGRSLRADVGQIGQPTADHMAYAAALLASLPDALKDAAHEPFGARALIYLLLIDPEPEPRRRQVERLRSHADPNVLREARRFEPLIGSLDVAARLPLIEMALPALRELTPAQFHTFRDNVEAMIQADDQVDLFEWVLRRLILHHLEPHFTGEVHRRTQYYSLARLTGEVSLLLSVLADVGHEEPVEAQETFVQAARHLELDGLRYRRTREAGVKELDDALDKLALAAPKLKRALLSACVTCISADGQVTVEEGELLRAVADTLDCPMPPLLPGQPLSPAGP